jgi:hypothetical protein
MSAVPTPWRKARAVHDPASGEEVLRAVRAAHGLKCADVSGGWPTAKRLVRVGR